MLKAQVSFGLKKKKQPKEIAMDEGPEVRPHPQAGYEYDEILADVNEEYRIEAEESLDFYIEYLSDAPLDVAKISYLVQYENSAPVAIDILAAFEGTKLRLITPDVHFGIVKSYFTETKEFEIENYSDVEAEVLVKSEKHKNLDMASSLL